MDSSLVAKNSEFVAIQRLGEKVGQHSIRWAVFQNDFTGLDLLSDKMMLNVEVFGPWMVRRILGDGDAALIILEDDGRLRLGISTLGEKLAKP